MILLKTSSGRELAVDMSKGGWEANPVENDMSKVEIIFSDIGPTDAITVKVEDYDRLKAVLVASPEVLDFTGE